MSLEPATLTAKDKAYLKSIRATPLATRHADHVPLAGGGPRTSSIFGHLYYGEVQRHAVQYLRTWHELTPKDVLITSFPRSGTHWIMKICLEI